MSPARTRPTRPGAKAAYPDLQGVRVLVTGASGFIGRHLCRELARRGADITAVVHTTPLPPGHGAARIVRADLCDPRQVERVVHTAHPELVWHLAAKVNARPDLELVEPTLRQTVTGAVHMMLALTRTPCRRLVVAGSIEEPRGGQPLSPYAVAKLAGTLYARMFSRVFGLPVQVVRLPLVYGSGQAADKLLPHLITHSLAGEPPALRTPDREVDLLYVDDAVAGLILAATPTLRGTRELDLGTGRGVRIADLAARVARLCGLRLRASPRRTPRGADEADLIARPEDARRILGWRPRWSLDRGLAHTVDEYRRDAAPRRARRTRA